MALFKFLAAVCKELDSLISSLCWGAGSADKKVHWVSHTTLGLSKQEGVWGFETLTISMMPYLQNSVGG